MPPGWAYREQPSYSSPVVRERGSNRTIRLNHLMRLSQLQSQYNISPSSKRYEPSSMRWYLYWFLICTCSSLQTWSLPILALSDRLTT